MGIKEFKKGIILLLIWFLIPLLIQMAIAKVFTARYILFIIPYFSMISSLGIFFFLNFLKRKLVYHILIYNILAGVLILLFVFEALRTDLKLLTDPQRAPLPKDERSGYLEEWTSGYGIKEVRDYLRKLPKEKQVIVGTEGYFGTLPDGLQIYFDKDPKVTIIGVGLGLDKVPDPLIDSASRGNPTFLVVNKSRLGVKDDPRLKLVMEFPKAEGKKGQDALLFYQVK